MDGAWWPHGADLAAEIPDVLEDLADRLGRIDRVLYHLDEWDTTPAKIASGDRRVSLDGYHRQPPGTIEVLGLDRGRVVLLVVPPGTGPEEAEALMTRAAKVDDVAAAGELLASAR